MKYLVTVLAVLAMVSVAGAAQQVWFTATSQNANSYVYVSPGVTNPAGWVGPTLQQGSAGNSLILGSYDPGLNGKWLISVYVKTEATLGGITGYDVCLTTPETDTYAEPYMYWNPDEEVWENRTFAPPSGWALDVGVLGNDGGLFRYGSSTFSGVGLVTASTRIARFYLNDVHEGNPETDYIYGGFNCYGWSYASSTDWPHVQYGDSAEIFGGLPFPRWTTTPVITILEPEPGTLMLLCLGGLVGLLRRR
jgi:hypothetical protein